MKLEKFIKLLTAEIRWCAIMRLNRPIQLCEEEFVWKPEIV